MLGLPRRVYHANNMAIYTPPLSRFSGRWKEPPRFGFLKAIKIIHHFLCALRVFAGKFRRKVRYVHLHCSAEVTCCDQFCLSSSICSRRRSIPPTRSSHMIDCFHPHPRTHIPRKPIYAARWRMMNLPTISQNITVRAPQLRLTQFSS